MARGTVCYIAADGSELAGIGIAVLRSLPKQNISANAGRKDIILKSTNTPFPLLHTQSGPCADKGFMEPQKGFAHMFCCLDKGPLIADLQKITCEPYATAALLHFNLKRCDWNFVLTSDL
jgi:hypothetical protein